jgi:hypothetical protein
MVGILHEHYAVDRNRWTFEEVAADPAEPIDKVPDGWIDRRGCRTSTALKRRRS